jgi:hypothetical protein
LPRFARSFAALTLPARKQITEFLFSRRAEEVKLQAKFHSPVKLQLQAKFQLLANSLQAQKQVEAQMRARPPAAAAE